MSMSAVWPRATLVLPMQLQATPGSAPLHEAPPRDSEQGLKTIRRRHFSKGGRGIPHVKAKLKAACLALVLSVVWRSASGSAFRRHLMRGLASRIFAVCGETILVSV